MPGPGAAQPAVWVHLVEVEPGTDVARAQYGLGRRGVHVFDERDHDGVQRYTLRRIDGDGAATTERHHLTRSPKLTPLWTPS
ncbi:hypothetical protein [Nocardia beijingensis]|uniref:hypothetical protein n=1 Tax=Nocardia beijingensis TaxID=95162 RepID=UPI0033DBB157